MSEVKQIEQTCLGCILLDSRTTLDMCVEKGVTAEYFTDPACRKIYETALDYFQNGKILDLRIVSNHFNDTSGKLSDPKFYEGMVDLVVTPQHASYYFDILSQSYVKKQIDKIAKKMQGLNSNEYSSVDDLVAKTQALTASLNRHQEAPHKDSVREKIVESYYGAKEGKCIGMPSFMPVFDSSTGGPRKGLHTIIAGPRGTGKSTILVNWVKHLGNLGIPTGVLPMEDGTTRFWARLASSYGCYSEWELSMGMASDKAIKQADEALKTVMSWPIYVDGHRGMTIDEIKSKASQYQNQHGIEALWLDGFKDIRRERSDTLAEEARISAGLCNVASLLDISVVSVHHVTKESSKNDENFFKLEDIRGSGVILDDARMVLILQPDQSLDCKKNNFGPTCSINLDIDLALCQVRQASSQDPRLEQKKKDKKPSWLKEGEIPFS